MLVGKDIFIACREGILRDHFKAIVADIKDLERLGVRTTLFHNIANRFANQQHFKTLARRLDCTRIIRVPSEKDFYNAVLDYPEPACKLIFLERKYLIDKEGGRINSLTTQSTRAAMGEYGDLIANVNFKGVLERICEKIDAGKIDRVHILPAGKNTIRNELFTLEGSGTLIANNFSETFKQVVSDEEINIVGGILDIYRGENFLLPRSKTYLIEKRGNFYITQIDGIIVGCVEKKPIDGQTVEMGALAISSKFRNQHIGIFMVNAFIREMLGQGYARLISLTNNPRLQALLISLGFIPESPPEYASRQAQSPKVTMFCKKISQ